jgi:16S rRNA (guanine527-N7)-methyltransferase
MSEDDAKAMVETIVGARSMPVLEQLAKLVMDENERQNLIARSTVSAMWSRHILDSVQLLAWGEEGVWLDIGSGGGFPGLAVAARHEGEVILVEPRKRRAAFLLQAASDLRLRNVSVVARRVEAIPSRPAATISARAVAPAENLLGLAIHCASSGTRWLLPRGANHENDLRAVRACWGGLFHVEQSLSDSVAGILIGTQVAPR